MLLLAWDANSYTIVLAQASSVTRPRQRAVLNLNAARSSMEYEALNHVNSETRFLRLLRNPTTDGHPIRFEAITGSLSRAPYYYALSYTWGNDHDMVTIDVAGKAVSVHRDLVDALSQCGLPIGELIWVDAQIALDDALARMIRNAHKGYHVEPYDFESTRHTLLALGQIHIAGNPLWEWARNYKSARRHQAASTVVSDSSHDRQRGSRLDLLRIPMTGDMGRIVDRVSQWRGRTPSPADEGSEQESRAVDACLRRNLQLGYRSNLSNTLVIGSCSSIDGYYT